jgi:hypothetical protein
LVQKRLKGIENIFQEIATEIFSQLGKNMDIYVWETLQPLIDVTREKETKPSSCHFADKMPRIQKKQY